jgi:DNA mismatch endonuclease (patch repair protein)
MSRIRSRGMRPEVVMHELLRSLLGPRRRILRNAPSLPGRPDFVVPRLRLVVFVDGCFWHSCPRHGHVPESNSEYWQSKLARNAARDKLIRRRLRAEGWAVWRVWEHQLKQGSIGRTRAALAARLRRLESGASNARPPQRVAPTREAQAR